jgi:hypothetical protein
MTFGTRAKYRHSVGLAWVAAGAILRQVIHRRRINLLRQAVTRRSLKLF